MHLGTLRLPLSGRFGPAGRWPFERQRSRLAVRNLPRAREVKRAAQKMGTDPMGNGYARRTHVCQHVWRAVGAAHVGTAQVYAWDRSKQRQPF